MSPADESLQPDVLETRQAAGFEVAVQRAATGVTVVSTDGPGGRFGQTVSAMCRVSTSPPLLLACLRRGSPASIAIRANRVFCVSVLSVKHRHLADSFAGRANPGLRPWDFSSGAWGAAPSGSPRLEDALATFDCAVHQIVPAGSHLIYIGHVMNTTLSDGKPLLHYARTYFRPAPLAGTEPRGTDPESSSLCGSGNR
jgi:flavin reductase